jgi:hypothetical protein
MYSNELGRLPVYGQFNFLDSNWQPEQTSSFRGTRNNLPNLPSSQTSNLDYSSSGPPFGDLGSTTNGYFAKPDVPVTFQPPLQGEMPSDWDFQPQGLRSGGVAAPFGNDMPLMDSDTLTMWSTAPTGFE